ncbi:MAG: hypothetical protein WDO73_12955 [Ignavibacteriota bacterium]
MAELLSQDERSLTVLGEVLGDSDGSHGTTRFQLPCRPFKTTPWPSITRSPPSCAWSTHSMCWGIMTRIESSRFEAEGAAFGGLAEAVSALSQQIREKIGATAGSATLLLQTAGKPWRTCGWWRKPGRKISGH